MKRWISAVVVGTTVSTLIVGCGTGGANNSSSSGTQNSTGSTSLATGKITSGNFPIFMKFNKKVTLNWWTWMSKPFDNKVIKEFEAKYPNITVKVNVFGDGTSEMSKLDTTLKAGSGAPDVAMLPYEYLQQYINTGDIANISAYDGYLKSYFLPWTWNQVKQGNKLYALPQDIEPMGLYYDSAALKKASLSVPKTWEQFSTEAAAYHKTTGKYMAFFPVNDGDWMGALLWDSGTKMFSGKGNNWKININNTSAKKMFEFWGNMIKAGSVKAVSDFTPQFESEVSKGDFATMVGAPWYMPAILSPYASKSQTWAVTQMPQWSSSTTPINGNMGGSSNVVTTQAKDKQAAALFVAWYSTSQTALNQILTPSSNDGGGLLPAAKASSTLSNFNSSAPILGGQKPYPEFKKAAANVNTSFEWSPWTTYFYNQLQVQAGKAAQGSITWSQALDNVQKSVVNYAQSQGYSVTQ